MSNNVLNERPINFSVISLAFTLPYWLVNVRSLSQYFHNNFTWLKSTKPNYHMHNDATAKCVQKTVQFIVWASVSVL